MPNDTIFLPFFPHFPINSATVTRALPAMLFLGGDAAAPGIKFDNGPVPQPAQRAVEGVLDQGRPVLLGADGHLLPAWVGHILGLALQRAGISDSTGIGLTQVPFADMMADGVTSLRQFLDNNPTVAPLVPVNMDELMAKTAVMLFIDYLVDILTRNLAAFTRGQVASQHEVAELLGKAWTAVEPMMKTSISAQYTLEGLRAFKQAAADKAKDSRAGREAAHSKGLTEGQQLERERQEAAVRAPASPTPTVVIQPAPTPANKPAAPSSEAANKTRRRGKRG